MRKAVLGLVCFALAFSSLHFPMHSAIARTASPVMPAVNTLSIEEQVFQAINRVRAENSLTPFYLKKDLSFVAREHSQDMAAHEYFSHVSPNGEGLQGRITRGGITNWSRLAENLAINQGYDDPVLIAVRGWMNSPGHRQNILDSNLTETGIGVAIDAKGKIYLTQLFAKRKN